MKLLTKNCGKKAGKAKLKINPNFAVRNQDEHRPIICYKKLNFHIIF